MDGIFNIQILEKAYKRESIVSSETTQSTKEVKIIYQRGTAICQREQEVTKRYWICQRDPKLVKEHWNCRRDLREPKRAGSVTEIHRFTNEEIAAFT